jgi:hypothetical protein
MFTAEVGAMNGTDYVIQAIGTVETVLTEIKASELSDGLGSLAEGASKALGDLGQVKGKATLRTRNGTNLAFPVLDAAQNLRDAWEEAKSEASQDPVQGPLEDFALAADALCGALKERTVIMT